MYKESSPARFRGTEVTLNMTDVSKRFLNETEVAEYAGLAVRTLQGWRVRGAGPPFKKLGGAVRYDRRDVEHWLDTRPGGGEPKEAA